MAGWPPLRAVAFNLYLVIRDADGDPLADPTALSAVLSKDGGAQATATNTPAVVSAGSKIVKLVLTPTEMTADEVAVVISSTSAGAKDAFVVLYTETRQIRDLAFPTVSGRSLDVAVGGEVGLDLDNTVGALAKGTEITGFNDLSAAQVNAEVDAALDTAIPVTPTAGSINDKIKPLTFTIANKVDASIQAATDFAQGAADKVWASATRTLTAFSTALALSVWDVLETAILTASSIGLKLKNNLDVVLSTRATQASVDIVDDFVDTEVAAIKVQTDKLTFDAGNRVAANLKAVSDNVDGPAFLDRSIRSMVQGTVGAGATTTSLPTSSLNPAASVADQFKGRIVVFDKDTTTAALRGQATDITANTALGVLTVTALTTAPVSGDTFMVV